MGKNVFIFHGIYGSPDENWFPWLKKELEERGVIVHIPHFPPHEHLKPVDWELIRSHCADFYIFHADNDPYLPKTKAEELAKYLHVDVAWVKGAGHFNAKAEYATFPVLLREVSEVL